jgi:predicted DNA-binding transcriptional regulator AlpA
MTTPSTDTNQERDSYSILEFCKRNGISRGTFYNMRADGKGPKEKRVMSRVLISKVAAAEWLAGAGA